MKKMITATLAISMILTACGENKDSKKSGGAPAPAPVVKKDGDKNSKDLIKPSDKKPVGLPDDKNDKAAQQTASNGKKKKSGSANSKQSAKVSKKTNAVVAPINVGGDANSKTAVQSSGQAETGAKADKQSSYVSLVNDGVMDKMKKSALGATSAQSHLNMTFAKQLENGKLVIDPVTQDVSVFLKVKEADGSKLYILAATPVEGNMVEMRPYFQSRNITATGRQDIRAQIECLDMSGRCQVAVMKVELNYGGGTKATALLTIRRMLSDVELQTKNINSTTKDLQNFREFILNSAIVYRGDNQVDDIYLESFEVAYGVSIVRTILIGKNSELVAHTAPLVSSQGGINWRMRSLDTGTEDIDLLELDYKKSNLSATLGAVSLRKADGRGHLVVTYRTRAQSSQADDEVTLTYSAKPVRVNLGSF